MIKCLRGVPTVPKQQFVASVLIPTRGRPERLKRAVHSLFDMAKEPKNIQLILRVDSDDHATLNMLTKEAPFEANVLVGPRGRGYLDLHHFIHEMAREAKGEWLVNFNDDAVMKTKHWDELISGMLFEGDDIKEMGDKGIMWFDGIWLLVPCLTTDFVANEFFVVNRRVFEVLGHLSNNTGVDIWLDNVFLAIGRRARVDIDIQHTNDEGDLTFAQGRATIKGKLLWDLTASLEVRRGRLHDAIRLLDYLAERREKGLGKIELEIVKEGLLFKDGKHIGLIPEEVVGDERELLERKRMLERKRAEADA